MALGITYLLHFFCFFIASDVGPCCRWDGFWSSASLWRVQRTVCVQEQCLSLHGIYYRLDQMCCKYTDAQQERMDNPKGRLWGLLTPFLLSHWLTLFMRLYKRENATLFLFFRFSLCRRVFLPTFLKHSHPLSPFSFLYKEVGCESNFLLLLPRVTARKGSRGSAYLIIQGCLPLSTKNTAC